MIGTVRENFENFTRQQVERALESRVVRRRVGHPSEERFKSVVSDNANNFDCPVEIADINNAKTIFGPHRPGLRGWSTRKRPKRVRVEKWPFRGIFTNSTSL